MARPDLTQTHPSQIKTRLILNFPGFEGTDPSHQIGRVEANGQKFGDVWDVEFNQEDEAPEDILSVANFKTTGNNWATQTRLIQFGWNDIIQKYEGQPYPQSFFANFPKYLSFFLDGTVIRYFITHWRYGVFTIYPMLALAVFAIISWFASTAIVGFAYGTSFWASLALTLIFIIALTKKPGDLWYMSLSINDWGFARDLANASSPAIEQRYDEFSRRLKTEIEASTHDEIIIVGHSFGTIWAVQALARALEKSPELLNKGNVSFFSLGSSLLKINLVPSAKQMREKSKIVFSQKSLLWDEYQTHIDLIAFHGTKPDQKLDLVNPETEIHIHGVRYSRVMEKQRYRKMRKSFYRSHRQYIMYQDIRCHFDFFLRCFGPIAFRELARQPDNFQRIDINGQLHDDPVIQNSENR